MTLISPDTSDSSGRGSPAPDGRLVSARGMGIRLGTSVEVPCYLVSIWDSAALPTRAYEDWHKVSLEIAERRTEAGLKGAYGKLAALTREADEAFDSMVAKILRDDDICWSPDVQEAVLSTVEQGEGYELIVAVVAGRSVQVLLALSGELGPDAIVKAWTEALPQVDWSPNVHVRSVLPAEAEETEVAMLASLGEVSVAPASEAQETSDSEISFHHVTVLLEETVDLVGAAEGKFIVDATLGGGGHTELMLERGATVWGIDQDPEARQAATRRLARFGTRFRAIPGNFRDIEALLNERGVSEVDGIIADLGVSSHQLDTPERGFSFRGDGPLDMRMQPDARMSAADLVNSADETELARILWEFGEERASRAIARAIVRARSIKPIETTLELADLISKVLPRKGKQHPATRSFQAIRIAVNDELGALDDLLSASVRLLRMNGRLAIITFHSLEDRRVKQFFDIHSRPEIDRPEWAAPRPNPDYCFRLLTRKPVKPTDQQQELNVRSRSSLLRAVEKIQNPAD